MGSRDKGEVTVSSTDDSRTNGYPQAKEWSWTLTSHITYIKLTQNG